jgi:hypothetical protein
LACENKHWAYSRVVEAMLRLSWNTIGSWMALNNPVSRLEWRIGTRIISRELQVCPDYFKSGISIEATRLLLQRNPLACSLFSSSTGSTRPAGISCLVCWASSSPSGTYFWAIIGAPPWSFEKSGLPLIALSFCKPLLFARRFFCLFITSSARASIAASPRRPHATPMPA